MVAPAKKIECLPGTNPVENVFDQWRHLES